MRKAFNIQKRVIFALFIRELKTRFGKYKLGYLWALLEPLAHMGLFLLIIGFIMHRVMPGIPFSIFLICGLVPYFMFSATALRSLNAIESNRGLLNYRPVHPLDTLITRALLELLIGVTVFAVLMLGFLFLGEDISLSDLPKLAAIWFGLSILGLGIGTLMMLLGHAFPESEKFMPLLIKPLYFVSAIMFPISVIPSEYRGWILWNPLVHAFELLRHSVYPAYTTEGISLSYLINSAVVCLFLGLVVYKYQETTLLKS